MRLDADGHVAQHVLVEAHQALHLVDGGRRRVDVEKRVIRLAILLDAVGEGLQTPVLDLENLAAIVFQDAPERLHQLVDLLVRDVLAR